MCGSLFSFLSLFLSHHFRKDFNLFPDFYYFIFSFQSHIFPTRLWRCVCRTSWCGRKRGLWWMKARIGGRRERSTSVPTILWLVYYNTRWTGNFCPSRPHQFGQFVCRFLFLFLETQGQYKARLNQYCVLVLPESYLIHESCTERRNLLYAHFSTFGLQMSSSMTWSSSTSLKSWTRSKMETFTPFVNSQVGALEIFNDKRVYYKVRSCQIISFNPGI